MPLSLVDLKNRVCSIHHWRKNAPLGRFFKLRSFFQIIRRLFYTRHFFTNRQVGSPPAVAGFSGKKGIEGTIIFMNE